MRTLISNRVSEKQFERLRDELKEFRGRFSEKDLLKAFCGAYDMWGPSNGEILKADVLASPTGFWGERTRLDIHMVVDCGMEMYKVQYSTDTDLNIDADENSMQLRRYIEGK